MPRKVCGIPLGGLGVLDTLSLGECANCKRDRARRRRGGAGGTLVTGDARVDAREEATMALESASSSIPPTSSMALELPFWDRLDIEATLGVDERKRLPVGSGFLKESKEGLERPVERGGSFGFSSSDAADDIGELVDKRGLGAWDRPMPENRSKLVLSSRSRLSTAVALV